MSAAAGLFAHLKRFEVRAGNTASLAIPILGPDAKLIGRPATASNPAWLARAFETPSIRGEGIRTVEALKRAMDELRVEFTKVVLTGWEGVCDKDGKQVEFTPDNCLELLRAIPDYTWNEIVAFFKNDLNFVTPDSIEAARARLGN